MRIWIAAGVALFCIGMFTGWKLGTRQDTAVPEKHADAVRQQDGSLVLERAPASVEVIPPHQVPKGAVVERVVRAKVQLPADRPCPTTVQVDMSLVATGNGHRVIVSSPDGNVVGGLDVPRIPDPTPRQLVHAIGLEYRFPTHAVGLFYDHDVGPMRLGVGLAYRLPTAGPVPQLAGLEVGGRIGLRF